MFDEQRICPYTGLRSFTEEESIYFKGRDEHIDEATKLLEKNKFLMLTGASGDGKSSLVYAGIIPNARSGFLKSQYSNWIVADFRPERRPFDNLVSSLSEALDIENPNTVRSELSYGFSALVDLYKSSKFYANRESDEWQSADSETRGKLERRSANLIVLADQFEEFFTNQENYQKGAASQDSNLVVNLLLETARIALEDNIPIYIVCTMRSDFIGQCAAFRGLPEYIGFSQFFVPRLNRKQLQEAILEPAELSGNQIAPRLVDRLIFDITEGEDQLPILQHALREIWKAANNGEEEMDLIHYAKVGGLPPEELPEIERNQLSDWFGQLPPKIRACYDEHNLHNVLNTHANKLYVEAGDVYKSKYGKEISDLDAKHIIRNTFVCLTKIDQSRAVRNRMTLSEITQITDIPGLTSLTVKQVTSIYRDFENTLIRPFIEEDIEDSIDDNDVLDITHESLIRNWSLLKQWAEEEYGYLTTYKDFEQQAFRWIDNSRSSDFLLSVGPLTHFEQWMENVQPNKYWIRRYSENIDNQEKQLTMASQKLRNLQEFLSKSAKKHAVTRTFMRYGAARISAVLAIIAIITLSSFYALDLYSQRPEIVYAKIQKEIHGLLKSDKVSDRNKALLAIEAERLQPGSYASMVSGLTHTQAFDISNQLIAEVTFRSLSQPNALVLQSILKSDSVLRYVYPKETTLEELIRDETQFINYLQYVKQYQSVSNLIDIQTEHTSILASKLMEGLKKGLDMNAGELNTAIHTVLNFGGWSEEDVQDILDVLSPIEAAYNAQYADLYGRNKYLICGETAAYGFAYNGLYQILGSLYAYNGDLAKTLQSIDSLIVNNEGYLESYSSMYDDGSNLLFYLTTEENKHLIEPFIEGYSNLSGIDKFTLYENALAKCRPNLFWNLYFASPNPDYHNLNLNFIEQDNLENLLESYENAIQSIRDKNQMHFEKALFLKLKGSILGHKRLLANGAYDTQSDSYFDESFVELNQVSSQYLAESVVWYDFVATVSTSRTEFFLNPDTQYRTNIIEPRRGEISFKNAYFLDYLTRHNLVAEHYTNALTKRIDLWFKDMMLADVQRDNGYSMTPIPTRLLPSLLSQIDQVEGVANKEITFQQFLLCSQLVNSGDFQSAKALYDQMDFTGLDATMNGRVFFLNFPIYRRICNLAADLSINGINPSIIIEAIDKPVNRPTLFGYIAKENAKSQKLETASDYIDLALQEAEFVDQQIHGNKVVLVNAYSEFPIDQYYAVARRQWRNLPEVNGFKTFGATLLAEGWASQGNLFLPYNDIDANTPEELKSFIYARMLSGYRNYKSIQSENDDWVLYDQNEPWYEDPVGYQ